MFIDRNIHYAGSYMLVIQYNLFFTEICGQALLVPSVYLERGGGHMVVLDNIHAKQCIRSKAMVYIYKGVQLSG